MIYDHIGILKLLKKLSNSIVFINIDAKLKEYQWEEYARKIMNDPETKEVRIGIISNTEDKVVKEKYLMDMNIQCGFIKLTENMEENINLLTTIFDANEIRGRRKYIRVQIENEDNSGFEIQADNTLYTGEILDISIAGMRCTFTNDDRFVINRKFTNIGLDLNGLLINTGGEITLHHEGTNSYVIMFEDIRELKQYNDLILFIYNTLQKKVDKSLKL
jgi:hypothetical protein